MRISAQDLLQNEHSKRELSDFLERVNRTETDFPKDKTVVDLISELAGSCPQRIALVFENQSLTYAQLETNSNRLAEFLSNREIGPGFVVAVLLERSLEIVIAMLAIWKAGAVFCPMSTRIPFERQKYIINDTAAAMLISQRKFTRDINRLQWECPKLRNILCLDSEDFFKEIEAGTSIMDQELWDYIGAEAHDDISAGGWKSAFSGEWLGREVMDQYSENIFRKLSPYLHKEMKILEIGCSSGISMFRLAPLVGEYYGVDISATILEYSRKEAARRGCGNIILKRLGAHEIDSLRADGFDIMILNSVAQSFSGHNYFRDTLRKSIDLMKDNGIIFLGHIWDQDEKAAHLKSIEDHLNRNKSTGKQVIADLTQDLYISRNFLRDLRYDLPEIESVEFSEMDADRRELSSYSFDAILKINKTAAPDRLLTAQRSRYQFDNRAVLQNSGESFRNRSEAGQAAYLIYTSGTSGQPKGVVNLHRSLVNVLLSEIEEIFKNYDGILRVAHILSFSFDASLIGLLASFLKGHTVYIVEDYIIYDSRLLAEYLISNQIEVFSSSPALLSVLFRDTVFRNQSGGLKHIIAGGEELPVSMVRDLYSIQGCSGVSITNAYGPTECCIEVSLQTINHESFQSYPKIPIGKPIQNVRIQILDSELLPVPVGIPGEICIAGEALGWGYLNDVELSHQRFMKSPQDGELLYRTGDIGRWLKSGVLEFMGRNDGQVKVRGFRVELGEVDSVIESHEGVLRSVTIAKNLCGDYRELLSYIQITEEDIDLKRLREFLRQRLPEYMIPSYFIPVDRYPLTLNGKVDKSALPLPEPSINGGNSRIFKTNNPIEERLQQIWKEILLLERVAINDNFFDIGGHSLSAVQMMYKIETTFGVHLPLSILFHESTIEQIAKHIQKKEEAVQYSPVIAVRKSGKLPPLFGFHPVGGNILCYYDLAQQLPGDLPLYMFQSTGLQKDPPIRLETVEQMADYYLKHIREIQPAGPYFLMGYSFGGMVAFDIARKLSAEGAEVPLLAILDCGTIHHSADELMKRDESGFIAHLLAEYLELDEEYMRTLDRDARLAYITREAHQAGVVDEGFGVENTKQMINIYSANGMAAVKYQPQPYTGKIVLFRAEEHSRSSFLDNDCTTLGWERYSAQEIELHFVPGKHDTMLIKPYVDTLAQKLSQIIRRMT